MLLQRVPWTEQWWESCADNKCPDIRGSPCLSGVCTVVLSAHVLDASPSQLPVLPLRLATLAWGSPHSWHLQHLPQLLQGGTGYSYNQWGLWGHHSKGPEASNDGDTKATVRPESHIPREERQWWSQHWGRAQIWRKQCVSQWGHICHAEIVCCATGILTLLPQSVLVPSILALSWGCSIPQG